MGGAPKKVERTVKKAGKKVTKFVDKKVVEPFIEKPVKKVATETFDTIMGVNKEERRAMLYGEEPSAGETQTPTQATETATSPSVKKSILAGQLGAGGESAKRRKFIS
tara:strand:- start:974 stop:1297 length:324 start_codon:yes stop_codon:yes gene_type:complete